MLLPKIVLLSLPLPALLATAKSAEDSVCSRMINDITNATEQCFFFQQNPQCDTHSDSEIDYVYFIYCQLVNERLRNAGFFLLAVWLCYLLLSLGVASNKFFAPNLPVIADALHMSESVAGETLMALGNGAPDLFTSLAVAVSMKDEGDMGFLYGELLGAGMFVTSIIVGMVVTIKPFKSMERALLRDMIFYIGAIYCTFVTMWDGIIHLTEALMFLVIYAVYIVSVLSAGYVSPRFDEFMAKHARNHHRRNNHIAKSSSEPSGLPSISQTLDNRENNSGSNLPKIIGIAITSPSPRASPKLVSASGFAKHSSSTSNRGSNSNGSDFDDSDETGEVSVAITETTTLPSLSQATSSNSAQLASVSFDSTEESVKLAQISLARGNRVRNKKRLATSQSMKVQQANKGRFKVDVELGRKMSRQLSLMVPPKKSQHLEAPKTKLERRIEQEAERERAKATSFIPHAARLMVRSASNKEKSASKQFEDVFATLPNRSNSTPTDRSPKRDSPTPTAKELQHIASRLIASMKQGSDVNSEQNPKSGDEMTEPSSSSGQRDSVVEPAVASTLKKSLLQLVYEGFNPIDVEKMRKQSCFRNFFHIVRAPSVFLFKLTIPVVNEDKALFNWNRPANLIHCITAPVFIALALFRDVGSSGQLPIAALVGVIGLVVAVMIGVFSSDNQRPRYHVAFAFLGFVTTMVWIYKIATEIISILQSFGLAMSISRSFLGLTFLAWGNSLSDVINNASLARQGYSKMAISAAYGGMLFNLLLGLGVPLTIATIRRNGHISFHPRPLVTVLILFLAANVLVSFIVIPLVQRFYLRRPFAIYLFIVYICFIVCAVLTEADVLHPDIFP